MKFKAQLLLIGALALGALVMGCFQIAGPALNGQKAPALAMGQPGGAGGGGRGGGGGEEGTETAVNNLSFPVIWADQAMALGEQQVGISALDGEWVYCADPDSDGNPVVYPSDTESPDPSWKKAFLQQDQDNVWTADAKIWINVPGVTGPTVVVDLIDWGDNLESQDWTTTSKVRTEVVLFKNLPDSTVLYGFEMLHVVGRGVDEMHGLSVLQPADENDDSSDAARAVLIEVDQPIVYTDHARLTIQKLNYDRDNDNGQAALLSWDPSDGKHCWVSVDAGGDDLGLVDAPLFNEAVSSDTTGPGGYSAEINIKGKIVYGYTWSPAEKGAEEGDYRLTFSLDANTGAAFETQTSILESSEEVADDRAAAAEPAVGGKAVVVPESNLTYIDIHLRARGGGGNGGGGKGSGGGGSGAGGGKGSGGKGGGGHAGEGDV